MTAHTKDELLLHIEDLSLEFETIESSVKVLKNVGFSIRRNEIVALVGESGSERALQPCQSCAC